ncbi:hypothetical protein ACIPT4_03695 [Pectobacterium jejuense]|uniref:hypothetical protein n=1 Tax=Pectobacterium jejuense TaxID=2974022 RepID=UPI0019698D2D|nr:hypothetical protein [Pectobacterium polaris]MBN3080056.1 hypothetical protein [Pectobacterium polaris]
MINVTTLTIQDRVKDFIFILLVSACTSDYCDALPVSERIMTFNECRHWVTLIHEKRPHATLLCAPINED